VVIFAISSIQLYQAYNELVASKEEKQSSLVEQKKLTKTQKALEKQVQLLQDEDYVAKVARNKYYYSKDGEKVYTIPDQANDDLANGSKEDTDK
jgi:cell division protein DivIC